MTWEKDSAEHRKLAKELAHSFSIKSMKALEPAMHKYVDAFVQKMKTLGDQDDRIELKNTYSPPPVKLAILRHWPVLISIRPVDRLGCTGYGGRFGFQLQNESTAGK